MNNVALVLYVIRVRDIKDNKYYNLDNIDGKSLVELFIEYCNEREKVSCNNNNNKAINIKKVEKNSNYVYGQIEYGTYGYSSEIKQIRTGQITHSKTIEEVDMVPLFFQAYVPNDAFKALIALEKFKTYGCKTILEDDINNFFAERDYKIKLTLHPILPEKVAKKYFQDGIITKMRLVKHTIPKDISDMYKSEYENGVFGTFEYVMTPKKNKGLPFKKNINKFLNNSLGLHHIVEIAGIDYDDIKVELDIGGKKRTISLNNIAKLTGDIDISNEVEFEINGHPKYSSIMNISREILGEYMKIIDYKNYRVEKGVENKTEVEVCGNNYSDNEKCYKVY